jgi:hypothetical protein
MSPGATTFNLTFRDAISTASALVIPMTPALAAA